MYEITDIETGKKLRGSSVELANILYYEPDTIRKMAQRSRVLGKRYEVRAVNKIVRIKSVFNREHIFLEGNELSLCGKYQKSDCGDKTSNNKCKSCFEKMERIKR